MAMTPEQEKKLLETIEDIHSKLGEIYNAESVYHNKYNANNKENDTMSEGFSTNDAVLTAAMSGGLGGNRNAWGNNGFGVPYANQASIQHGIENNRQHSENQADSTREILGKSIDANTSAFENLTRQNQFNRLTDRVFEQEFRTSDKIAAVVSEMNANARENAKCCCDAKILAVENTARLEAEIKASETRAITRDLDRAERSLQTQTILSTCGCSNGSCNS